MDAKSKKMLLFIVDFYVALPMVYLSLMTWFSFGSEELSSLIIVPVIGFVIWVLALIIGPIIGFIKGMKEIRQKQLADSKLQKRPNHTVYQANTVIFEQLKIRQGKMALPVLGIIVIPIYVFLGILFLLFLDFEVAWILGIFGALYAIGLHMFFLYWFHEEETKYKYFPGCPEQFRHEVSVEFDLNTQGRALCKFTLPGYHTDQLKELEGIFYNSTTKTLVCMWGAITKFRYSIGTRRSRKDSLAITLASPQSEELYSLLKENGVPNIQELSLSNGNYIAKAINEK